MTKAQVCETREEQNKRILKGFRLIDDTFMTKCFETDPTCAELVLRIVLNMPDLTVVEVRTQDFIENLTSRSVRLDILATDSKGRKFNVEVQRLDAGADPRRARFHCSVVDVEILDKGTKFTDLPELWVVFITENDVIGKGLPLYPVERYFAGTNELFNDGSHILYVNGAYQDDSSLGRLMHDFFCTEPDDMYYETLANRARYLKKTEKGVAIMCKAMDELYQRGVDFGRVEGREEGIGIGRVEGIGIGREEGIGIGRQEQCIEIAKAMLIDGEPIEKIIRYTPLKKSEIEKLRFQLQ